MGKTKKEYHLKKYDEPEENILEVYTNKRDADRACKELNDRWGKEYYIKPTNKQDGKQNNNS